MSRRLKAYRVPIRIAFGLAALSAFAAYLSVIAVARQDRAREWRPDRFVEQLGIEASQVVRAKRETDTGYLDMGRDSRATWTIVAPNVPSDRRLATIVTNDAYFADPSAFVSVDVGGSRMLFLQPGTTHPHSAFRDESPFVDVMAPSTPDRGFRFIVPVANACAAGACAVVVRTHAARWRIYRVGITEERAIDAVGEYR